MRAQIAAVGVMGFFASTAVQAKGLYLTCIQTSGSNQIQQEVFLNEDAGTANFTTVNTGNVEQNVSATFKANEIDLSLRDGSHYIIDRTTLASRFMLGPLGAPAAEGTCHVVKVNPKRQI